jgi:hypothetical protein
MGLADEVVDGDKDFAALLTMDEMLVMVIEQCELAREASGLKLRAHLSMASRAMRCALEIYGAHLAQKEKSSEKV